MATRDTGGQQRSTRTREETDEVEATVDAEVAERHKEMSEDVDSILDEIDGVLEENAEEFVRAYVQKGGQRHDPFPWNRAGAAQVCRNWGEELPLTEFTRNATPGRLRLLLPAACFEHARPTGAIPITHRASPATPRGTTTQDASIDGTARRSGPVRGRPGGAPVGGQVRRGACSQAGRGATRPA